MAFVLKRELLMRKGKILTVALALAVLGAFRLGND
jgi:hypothetical protein